MTGSDTSPVTTGNRLMAKVCLDAGRIRNLLCEDKNLIKITLASPLTYDSVSRVHEGITSSNFHFKLLNSVGFVSDSISHWKHF